MFIIKTLAHYANEVSARIAVIKRKYILYGVAERGKERGAKFVQKAIRWKIKSKRIQIPSALVWVCVRAFIMSSHALYIRYKIQNIKK